MIIKILGTGCKKCNLLEENVKKAVTGTNADVQVEKVTDLGEITGYGVMSTPALVIDDRVVSQGKVLKPKDIEGFIQKLG
ncbi:TM0996/MTH895 family glutaredoxin-like protein [Alkalibacter rhizosphaerae]|uniref:TM0996/MTH895 family glutaredoxin-like protein n=1 Tax=Alkalibacter rhizosphaerae TaxID=2815577 RepID=A0A975AHH1_9FIRM|nr:thioredoxin family protein [Alkalibacter rhizosphaerae]QSX08452.1 TM0996/MTH895 family glutaredoxin-like protein [Alkalibacter rhizosphaerae]